MSCVYQIDSVRRAIHVILEGEISGDELIAFQQSLHGDPRYDADFDQLVDVRRWQAPVADVGTLQQLALGMAPSDERRLAIVVASTLHYGVSREFAGLANLPPSRFGIFDRLGGARRWLQIDTPTSAVRPSCRDTV